MTHSHPLRAITRGIHHAGLTVPDANAARRFFADALGFAQVGEVADYPAYFMSDGSTLVTLWQAEDAKSAVPFDRRRNLGLHHLAFRVTDLDEVHAILADRDDVEMEFPPEQLGSGPARHLMCRGPGGIRIEFIVPAS